MNPCPPTNRSLPVLPPSAPPQPLPHNHARYDLGGNMTNDGQNTLVYDAENRAVSATNGGSAGAYVYDGNGLRVKKCVPNCTSPTSYTVYVFSGPKVVAEYDNGAGVGSPSREYIYSGSALVARIDSSGTKYYHQDHLSNRLVTDSSGNTVAQMGHYPFGESWYNASNDKLVFASYERDSESGNDYAKARFYISRLGRFSSPDKIAGDLGDPQSLNRYAYVRNSPVNFTDSTGKDPDCGEDDARIHKRRSFQVASLDKYLLGLVAALWTDDGCGDSGGGGGGGGGGDTGGDNGGDNSGDNGSNNGSTCDENGNCTSPDGSTTCDANGNCTSTGDSVTVNADPEDPQSPPDAPDLGSGIPGGPLPTWGSPQGPPPPPVSELCKKALKKAGQKPSVLAKSTQFWGALQKAANYQGVDVSILASMAIRENGFNNGPERGGGGGGQGWMQLDTGTWGVVPWASNANPVFAFVAAAGQLRQGIEHYQRLGYGPWGQLAGGIRAYNAGYSIGNRLRAVDQDGISQFADRGTAPGNPTYVSNVLAIARECFGFPQ